MTTLNLISHRLYAAAAHHFERPQRKPARSADSPWPGTRETRDLDFELVLDSKPQAPGAFDQARPCHSRR